MFGTKPLTRFVIWCAAGICVLAMTTTAGCVAFHPMTIDEVPFRQRAQTQEQDLVSVTVAVPSSRETKKLFGVNLSRQNIQPVWLEIRNKDTVPYWFFPSHLDPAYYSPNEAAFKHRLPLGGETHQNLTHHFQAVSLDNYIPPGTTNSGFVYCNLDEGIKHVNVTLLGIK
ncbi:MAG: hypothetical protein GXY44_16320 [Phycisphaerales bacterium]|nr:hypothetical protein [Phycisphaerales bacterium]